MPVCSCVCMRCPRTFPIAPRCLSPTRRRHPHKRRLLFPPRDTGCHIPTGRLSRAGRWRPAARCSRQRHKLTHTSRNTLVECGNRPCPNFPNSRRTPACTRLSPVPGFPYRICLCYPTPLCCRLPSRVRSPPVSALLPCAVFPWHPRSRRSIGRHSGSRSFPSLLRDRSP